MASVQGVRSSKRQENQENDNAETAGEQRHADGQQLDRRFRVLITAGLRFFARSGC